MKWIVGAVLLALVGTANGQPISGLPQIGELFSRSPRDLAAITEGCPLTYFPSRRTFGCLDARLVSLYRPAESFNLGTAVPPELDCSEPVCVLLFPHTEDTTASLDWIMPSQALTGSSLLLAWRASAADGTTVWDVGYCTYQVGEPPCTPATGVYRLVSGVIGAGVRIDAELNPFSPSWEITRHVVMHVTRRTSDSQDTLEADAALEGVRIELAQ